MYVCLCVYKHIVNIYTCMYACMYVYMFIYIYVYTYHMYTFRDERAPHGSAHIFQGERAHHASAYMFTYSEVEGLFMALRTYVFSPEEMELTTPCVYIFIHKPGGEGAHQGTCTVCAGSKKEKGLFGG